MPSMRDFAEQNRSVVKGWTLCVTVNPFTNWLSRHGHPVQDRFTIINNAGSRMVTIAPQSEMEL